MTNLTRWGLWAIWIAATAWLWNEGALTAGLAWTAGAASLLVFALPVQSHRRRRSELRYVEVGKQPMELS
ncbi:MAG: hypothetical protein KKC79_03315 [Gammaproteobacteria bacterium]|nr:hypothetical protein [Gammaproteobacteria bacterium]MBU1440330.1 hypothetical protein [Gammaproteobacteria bacterium]MBU2407660.1 hypothetical protein [Gammaproteobacteria bacterium]